MGWAAPFMPYLSYAIQQDYFAEILCINKDKPKLMCNGQCILMQQIALAEQLAEEQNPSTPAELPSLQLEESPAQWLPLENEPTSAEEVRSAIQGVAYALLHEAPSFSPLTPPPQA